MFCDRSRKLRLGSETRFSMRRISLLAKFRYFTFSSPSNKGTCFSYLPSRIIFSGWFSLSEGRRYMIQMLGIYLSSTRRERESRSTKWSWPCLTRYLYRSSFSSAKSLRIMLGSGFMSFDTVEPIPLPDWLTTLRGLPLANLLVVLLYAACELPNRLLPIFFTLSSK